MRILLLFTAYRQYDEYDYQAKFLGKCQFLPSNMEILVHCNNSQISPNDLQQKVEQLPCQKCQIIYGNNSGGYLRGQFQAIVDVFELILQGEYDYVIHLHPDMFIIDETPLVRLLKTYFDSDKQLFVSRIFGKTDASFATDFFVFKPSRLLLDLFQSYDRFEQAFSIPLEQIFYELIHNFKIQYVEVERFKSGKYFRDIDELGLWHEHRLQKVKLFLLFPPLRHLFTVRDLFVQPQLSVAILRNYIVRLLAGVSQDSLIKQLSR